MTLTCFKVTHKFKKKKKKSRIATESKIENFKPPPNQYNKKSPKTQKFRLVLLCPLCWTICFFTPVLDIVNCYFIVASFYLFFILSLSLSQTYHSIPRPFLSLTLPPAPPTSQSSLWRHHGGWFMVVCGFIEGFWIFRI